MDHNQQHVTIKTLDNSIRVLFWSVEEFLCMVIPIFAAIFFFIIWLALASIVLKMLYKRIKRTMVRGAISHRLYWILPHGALKNLGMITKFPPSHYRELIL